MSHLVRDLDGDIEQWWHSDGGDVICTGSPRLHLLPPNSSSCTACEPDSGNNSCLFSDANFEVIGSSGPELIPGKGFQQTRR